MDSNSKPTLCPKDSVKRDALESDLQALLNKNVIFPVQEMERGKEIYSIVLLVPKLNGGYRLVIDLNRVNKFVKKIPFKADAFQRIIQLIPKDHSMVTLDPMHAYQHYLMTDEHQR